jgi:uncharacterized protein (TIGR03546 family)
MIGAIGKLIAGINGYQRPGEIAAGFACGLFLATLPGANLLWWVFFIAFALVKINKGAMLLTLLFFPPLMSLIDPLLHQLGYALLTWELLQPFYVWFAGVPLAALTRFNNSLVMGALALGLPLWILANILFRVFLKFYRSTIRDKFIRPKLVPWLKRIPLVKYLVFAFEALSRAAGAAWR